ncbi:hypothetical protein [Roseateles terrae]|uniref:Uncharacterized protein n=1 Tax=Roseateles terrae TaxID=431060 RepID=A0ABR6GX58_9BURK|nr:hypothetical protein [Roseateles terrae]MBB3196272.1 hypothetical protein [Roseateles terrae]
MLAQKIEEAFGHRARPASLIQSKELSEDEIAGIDSVAASDWRRLTVDTLEKHSDAITLMAPQAFAYFLPGVMLATFNEGIPNAIAAVSVVSQLDRTPDRALWDSHFLARWPLLSLPELEAVAEWVLWLDGTGEFCLDELSMIRALATLDLLKKDVLRG